MSEASRIVSQTKLVVRVATVCEAIMFALDTVFQARNSMLIDVIMLLLAVIDAVFINIIRLDSQVLAPDSTLC